MRFLKRLIIGVVLLVAVLAVVGMLLPREVAVARSTTINAPADQIFPHINELEKTVPWSPWLHHDPETKLTYSDLKAGKGASMSWASDHPNVGSGSMLITNSVANQRLDVALDFGDMGTGTAYWDLVAAGSATEVTWGMVADMGMNPVGRWMGLMMDKWVGADYDRGLANLKALVEG